MGRPVRGVPTAMKTEEMKTTLIIDIAILALAPVLSAIALAAELATGVMPFQFSWGWIVYRSIAPLVWFQYADIQAMVLWILPSAFLILMILSARRLWRRRSFTCAALFDLYWILAVHLFVRADVMGQC